MKTYTVINIVEDKTVLDTLNVETYISFVRRVTKENEDVTEIKTESDADWYIRNFSGNLKVVKTETIF